MNTADLADIRIGIIGLGYVGLPLAVAMARHFPVVGFDVNSERICELREHEDVTAEVTAAEFADAKDISFTSDAADLRTCNFYIVTVPTPIDIANRPNLSALHKASQTVGSVLSRNDTVVYESTVYPGATEEECVPILEETSGLEFNQDFFVGYSPERINPGDAKHRITDILKVTSGSTKATADYVDAVYGRVITAGTHKASSVRVAEAAKVIENIQRDVNIALINELAMLFKKLGLESREVLEAAGTKWNFHNYQPGLVGGHCIGVDPYYLTHKAQSIGFHPEMILAGRRINDQMSSFVAHDVIKTMLQRNQRVDGARVLVMGFTFKENCPDLRNTRVADLVKELSGFVGRVDVYDPIADAAEAMQEYGIRIVNTKPTDLYDTVILAVRHDAIIKTRTEELRTLLLPDGLLYDMKRILDHEHSDARI